MHSDPSIRQVIETNFVIREFRKLPLARRQDIAKNLHGGPTSLAVAAADLFDILLQGQDEDSFALYMDSLPVDLWAYLKEEWENKTLWLGSVFEKGIKDDENPDLEELQIPLPPKT